MSSRLLFRAIAMLLAGSLAGGCGTGPTPLMDDIPSALGHFRAYGLMRGYWKRTLHRQCASAPPRAKAVVNPMVGGDAPPSCSD